MSSLERQYALMAVATVASLAVFFGYFFYPRSQTRSAVEAPRLNTGGQGFVPVSSQWGIDFHHQRASVLGDIAQITGSGACLADFDGNGWVDVYLVNSSVSSTQRQHCALYLNQGNGRFVPVPDAGGADPGGLNMGVCCADYDNDGHQDFYVTRIGPDRLFRGDGHGRFHDVTEAAGISNSEWGTSAAFEDFDRDGRLDLFVANYLAFDPHHLPQHASRGLDRDEMAPFNPYLYQSAPDRLFRNQGDGTFTDVTESAGIRDERGKGLGVAFTDLNADGLPDVYVVNDVSPNLLFMNQGDGRFKERGLPAGVADPRSGMGITIGDYDADGYFDLFSTHWQDELNVLYRNLGPPRGAVKGGAAPADRPLRSSVADDYLMFDDVTASAGLGWTAMGVTGWGTVFFDADQDGDLDLYITNGYTSPSPADASTCVRQADYLLMNENGRFVDRSRELLKEVPPAAGRGLAAADLDGDGDLDLVRTSNNGPAVVLENRCAWGSWLIVKPAGIVTVGCEIVVETGELRQRRVIQSGTSFLSCEPAEAHFGLGKAAVIDRLEVIWPDGRRRTWTALAVNRRFTAEPP